MNVDKLVDYLPINESSDGTGVKAKILFSKFFESMMEGMIITDREGVILSVNLAFTTITGYEAEEVIGQKPNVLRSGRHDKQFYDDMWSSIELGGKWEGEVYNKRKNGEIYPQHVAIVAIRDDETGQFSNMIAIFTDLTKIKKDESTIKRQAELLISQSRYAAMGEMINMIAHQWRQPLTAIGMTSNNLLIDLEFGDKNQDSFRSQLETINTHVQQLSETIENFRSFFKPKTELVRISVPKLVENAVKIIHKSLEDISIDIKIESECANDGVLSENIVVNVHEGEFMQTLFAILGNAKDALVENAIALPRVTLGCGANMTEGYMELRIKDNAGGVDEAIVDKIFEPYFTTKSAKNGTGLGLYIAKIIIEKHQNGSIGVRNEDGGACFWIRLPLSR